MYSWKVWNSRSEGRGVKVEGSFIYFFYFFYIQNLFHCIYPFENYFVNVLPLSLTPWSLFYFIDTVSDRLNTQVLILKEILWFFYAFFVCFFKLVLISAQSRSTDRSGGSFLSENISNEESKHLKLQPRKMSRFC